MAFLYRLLPPRPTFAEDMRLEEAAVMQRHAAYWHDLLDRRVAVAFGPVSDPKGTWGLALLELEDEQAAQEVAEHDPAVETGTCSYEVLPMQLSLSG